MGQRLYLPLSFLTGGGEGQGEGQSQDYWEAQPPEVGEPQGHED